MMGKTRNHLPVLNEIPEKTAMEGSASESDCNVTTVLPVTSTPTIKFYFLGLKTPRKQTTKLLLQNFKKLLIETVSFILKNQILEGKHCRSR